MVWGISFHWEVLSESVGNILNYPLQSYYQLVVLPDLTISPDIMPPFRQKWGYDHRSKCNMDRLGIVGSPLAGFLMGLGKRPPLQRFHIFCRGSISVNSGHLNSYVGLGMFFSAPAKKN